MLQGIALSRAFDHFVLATADLDALAQRFQALGFSVGGENIHPFGTRNRIIQLADQSFLELIGLHDVSLIKGGSGFAFAPFVRDAIAHRPGMAMLVLRSEDAKADSARFKALGMGDIAPFHFGRKGTKPDGTPTEVAFTLAFAVDKAMPEIGFFTCQHHFPQNFWASAAQKHANTAQGVARVTIVAENPSDHHIFLGNFIGEREMRSTSFGVEIVAGKSLVEIISPEGFAFRYGCAAPKAGTPIFAGLEIAVANPGALKGGQPHAGGITFAPEPRFNTALRFVPATGGAL
jgi:Glyoxalase-like domain